MFHFALKIEKRLVKDYFKSLTSLDFTYIYDNSKKSA